MLRDLVVAQLRPVGVLQRGDDGLLFVLVAFHDFDAEPYPPGLRLSGWVACRGQILVTYDKLLLTVGEQGSDLLVQTEWYSYNAIVQGKHGILRYDNQHGDLLPGHADEHHKHVFDFETGDAMQSPEWIGEHQWPHLSDVIQECETWHAANYAKLPSPDAYAVKPDRWP